MIKIKVPIIYNDLHNISKNLTLNLLYENENILLKEKPINSNKFKKYTIESISVQNFFEFFNYSITNNYLSFNKRRKITKYSSIYVGVAMDFDIEMINQDIRKAIEKGFIDAKKSF